MLERYLVIANLAIKPIISNIWSSWLLQLHSIPKHAKGIWDAVADILDEDASAHRNQSLSEDDECSEFYWFLLEESVGIWRNVGKW